MLRLLLRLALLLVVAAAAARGGGGGGGSGSSCSTTAAAAAAATAKLQVASRAGLPPILLLCLFMTLLQSNTTHVREPLISVEQNRCSD